MIRVMIFDDHPIVRRGVEQALRAEPDVLPCGSAESLDDFSQRLAELRPDVIVLDLGLARSAIETTLEDARRARVPVVLFTMEEDPATIDLARRAGAADYVHKGQPVQALLDALRRVAQPRTRVSPPPQLTPTERYIVGALCAGRTPKEIAFDVGASTSTVYTHVERARRKLGAETTAELIRRAIERGLT